MSDSISAVQHSLRLADKRGEPYVCATVELHREDLRAVLWMLDVNRAKVKKLRETLEYILVARRDDAVSFGVAEMVRDALRDTRGVP